MDQIRANTPAPIKANLMTEQLSVQMSWGNGGCTRAGSPGDQQSRELGPWSARRSRAMLRANAWGHDELSRRLIRSLWQFSMQNTSHAEYMDGNSNGRAIGVYRELSEENRPRYIGNAMYFANCVLKLRLLQRHIPPENYVK